MVSVVIPAKAEIHDSKLKLNNFSIDSRLRGNDTVGVVNRVIQIQEF
jgi:hypothetical protein